MMNDQQLNLMQLALREIVNLRNQIRDLEPKAHAYDTIAIQTRLLAPAPYNSPEGVDVAYALSKAISENA